MIKYIVSDLDDTLLYGHGKHNIFDLTKENINAIKALKNTNIQLVVASGRTYLHGLKILEMFNMEENGICCGLNGSIYYDSGKLFKQKIIKTSDVLEMIKMIENDRDDYFNMQIQDLGEQRAYLYPNMEPSLKYLKECELLGIGKWQDIDLITFLNNNPTFEIGKFSITSHYGESSSKLEAIIKAKYGAIYNITRSGKGYLEITNKDANKGNFIKFIKDRYHITCEEIAIVGDNYNDISMFNESKMTFCMAQSDDAVKQHAKYIVDDVAMCINMCIKLNADEIIESNK